MPFMRTKLSRLYYPMGIIMLQVNGSCKMHAVYKSDASTGRGLLLVNIPFARSVMPQPGLIVEHGL